jgi:hypothetical protein
MSEPQSGDGERRPGTKTANPHAKAHNRSGAHGDRYAHTPGSITTGPGAPPNAGGSGRASAAATRTPASRQAAASNGVYFLPYSPAMG